MSDQPTHEAPAPKSVIVRRFVCDTCGFAIWADSATNCPKCWERLFYRHLREAR